MQPNEQTVHIQLTLEHDLMEKFRYIADYNFRSLRREVIQLVKQHIKQFEAEHGTIKPPSN